MDCDQSLQESDEIRTAHPTHLKLMWFRNFGCTMSVLEQVHLIIMPFNTAKVSRSVSTHNSTCHLPRRSQPDWIVIVERRTPYNMANDAFNYCLRLFIFLSRKRDARHFSPGAFLNKLSNLSTSIMLNLSWAISELFTKITNWCSMYM